MFHHAKVDQDRFELPELPYGYDALTPHIDEETMQLHHQHHHQGYVDGLNEAIQKLRNADRTNDYDMIQHWQRQLSFHWAGHRNHQLFFRCLTPPHRSGEPQGRLRSMIAQRFDSVSGLRRRFQKAGSSVEGSGWVMLCVDNAQTVLEVETVQNHQHSFPPGLQPILAVDVWEHAYYLQYRNDRESYLQQVWHILDWDYIHNRLLAT
jgi:Fe-Mn family superoxide dismutase